MQYCQRYVATTKHLHCSILQGIVALPRAPRALAQAVVLGASVIFSVPDKACRERERVENISALSREGGWWSASGTCLPAL